MRNAFAGQRSSVKVRDWMLFQRGLSSCGSAEGGRAAVLADSAAGTYGYGDSPYQSFSAFAGNPYLIDLEDFIQKGLLTREECDQADFGDNPRDIDYEKLYRNRFPVLRRAFERWRERQFQAGYDEKQMEHIFSKKAF